MKWIFVAPLLIAGSMAKAAPVTPVDLNTLSGNPLVILEGIAPEMMDKDKDDKDHDKDHGKDTDKMKEIPAACKEAAFTDDQKTKVKESVYNSLREKVQLDANLKLAKMAYAKTVFDPASDLAAAEGASADITKAVGALVDNHMALGNDIIYNIATPEQRAKTVECIARLHKMGKDHKCPHQM